MRLVPVLQRTLVLSLAASLVATWSGCLGCGGSEPTEGSGAAPGEIAPQVASEPVKAGDLRARFPDHAAHVLEASGSFAAADDGFLPAASAIPAARRGLTARLPKTGSTAIRFELPSGFTTEVRERGLAGEGAIAGRAVAYARDGGTSYWAATDEGYEEWLMLDPGVATADRDAATWEVAGGTLRQAGDAVEIADDGGVARVVVRAPAAYDAAGRPVGVRLAVNGATIALRVDAAGEAVLVDPSWVATTSMITGRAIHAAVLLNNGKALIAGGTTAGIASSLTSAELYDPATGGWSSAGNMTTGRYRHAMVLLGSGKAFAVGGFDVTTGGYLQNSTIYDPALNSWTAGPSMTTGRSGPTATVLQNGKVLVVGGLSSLQYEATAELYDPATNTFSAAGTTGTGRRFHAAVLLGNGKVLVAGGYNGAYLTSASLYDPATNTWTAAASMTAARAGGTNMPLPSVLLPNGNALVISGYNGVSYLTNAEMYNPTTNSWSTVTGLPTGRGDHTATLLGSGLVLVPGGGNPNATTSTVQYDSTAGTWSAVALMTVAREAYTATLLPNGKVLAAGGTQDTAVSLVMTNAELFTGNQALGTACTVGGDCASGFCADKVCCSTACNGGACDACSVAAGSTADGTCTLFSGLTCSDGSACTQTDVCQSGVCVGSNPVVCPAADQCHQPSTCNPATGVCSNVPKPNGTACTDGDACTAGDTCQAGVCTSGAAVTCTALDQCHTAGTCDPVTGCSNPAKVDGTACSDGSACTMGDVCVAGSCTAGSTVTCPIADQCHQPSTCNPATGVCSNVPKPNGTACSDGNACTQNDTCQAGVCTSGAAVTCTALDQCHTAGTCDPVTGCSNPAKIDGTPCNDGSACTLSDVCVAGSCTGGNAVMCPAPTDACHSAGVCNPATGVCSNPVKPNGSTCSDGNACTQNDTCQAGACTAGAPVVCAPLDQCHTAGTCDPTTGMCSSPPKADGTGCNDNSLCTQLDLCQAGVCVGQNPVTCPGPTDACHDMGVCNPQTGACSNPAKPDGSTCTDGNACTQADTCQAGVCAGGPPVVCAPPDDCHDPGACNPVNGVCSYPTKADGTGCNDNDACTQVDLCQAGVCKGQNPVSCPVLDECHDQGVCNPQSGKCSNPAKPDGTACSSGVCSAGTCGAAPDGGTDGGTGGSGNGGAGNGGAGNGGAGNGAGTGGISTGNGGSASTSGGGGKVDTSGSCGCRTAPAPGASPLWLGLGLLLAARRRGSRRARD